MARIAAALSLASVLIVCTGSSSTAALAPAATCKDLKAKGTGKYELGLLKAFGRNTRKPNVTKLGTDLSKARSRLTRAFQRAESSGACETTGDAGTMEGKAGAFVLDAIGHVSPVCGDGMTAGSEECDLPDDSACPGLCLADCSCAPPECGNDIIEPGEACDGSALGACYECGALGSAGECQCCWPTGYPYACMGVPCCDPTAWCLIGGPGQGYVCSPCSGRGGGCGIFVGEIAGFCCEGFVCLIDNYWDQFTQTGVCQPVTCAEPADCLATQGCENEQCCAQTGEVCGNSDSGVLLPCCGGGLCSRPVQSTGGILTCCLDTGATCATGAECCSESCNAGTFTCDP